VRNGPKHELTADELIAFWSDLPSEAREILSEVIVDKVVQPQRSRTLSEAVAACEAKRRRQLGRMRARLVREQERVTNGGAPATGRPKARQNRYSGQQLQALSRAWDRFENVSRREGSNYETPSAKVDAFVRSLARPQREWLPESVRADTVRKLLQSGRALRQGSKAWRAHSDVADALHRLMQIETDRREINRIVRELASLQPGTEIAERRLTTFVSETVLRHHAIMSVFGIEESFINVQAK
jgi:hypothetical protein